MTTTRITRLRELLQYSKLDQIELQNCQKLKFTPDYFIEYHADYFIEYHACITSVCFGIGVT